MILILLFSLLLQGSLGELICDELPAEMCAFSIASSGKRCILETSDNGAGALECKTSEVFVHSIRDHIETDSCIAACGADRNVIGISSDFVFDSIFKAKLCSQQCLNNCPNIVDLYSNLALAEGVLLSKLCKTVETGLGRGMSQLGSSGITASSPVSGVGAGGPISAPAASPIPVGGGVAVGGPISAPTAAPIPVGGGGAAPIGSAVSAPTPL